MGNFEFSTELLPGLPEELGLECLFPLPYTAHRLVYRVMELLCLTRCEGKQVVMGGWDPVNYDPVTDVFIYDFMSQQWRQGKDMPSKRSFFAIGACSGRIFIAGGHDENKNAS
ncbi:hypothetical protein F3Y22_tig00003041pilonHSYRG00519 [Hibiscus syriacus]|uniref:Galactose oxidase/kelch repeat superfamily protein n=1 Tax=Hibiscus syriacus TaxID=106335 RepID=A0A6A3CKX9_HIBSY|nr:hypothetical protein F3Y22_tig00003041pilonHSYRG00519 [Hibiscus syriacus]